MCWCVCLCVSELLKRNYTFWVSWSANLVAGAASCRLSPLSPYRSTLASSHCGGDLQNWPTALLNPQVSPFLTPTNTYTHSYTPTHTHVISHNIERRWHCWPFFFSFCSFLPHTFCLVFFFFILTTRVHYALAERVYTLRRIAETPICFVDPSILCYILITPWGLALSSQLNLFRNLTYSVI